MRVVLVVGIFMLVACASPEERAERAIANFGPYCEKLGYGKNTDPWRDCIQKEHARVTSAIGAIVNDDKSTRSRR